MDRLTGRNREGGACFNKCFEEPCNGEGASDRCDKCDYLLDVCEKLAHYEDMEEQGKLLMLPCKPGDTVYVILKCKHIIPIRGVLYNPGEGRGTGVGNYCCPYELDDNCPHKPVDFSCCEDHENNNAVFKDTVSFIEIRKDGLYVVCKKTRIVLKIGVHAFLTEREAKEALKGMKE